MGYGGELLLLEWGWWVQIALQGLQKGAVEWGFRGQGSQWVAGD